MLSKSVTMSIRRILRIKSPFYWDQERKLVHKRKLLTLHHYIEKRNIAFSFFKTKIMQGIVKCLVVFSPGKCFSNDNRKAFRGFLFAKVKTSAFNRRKATNSLECWIDTGTITALL